jgi:hydroxymethylpyrimidine/phosphomethylpyrimidine kinase
MSASAATAPAVLVIAGSDSSGGAGLARDLRTLESQGVEALIALTAVTAQSDSRLWAVHPVPPELIRAQILSALESRSVGAVKIGMLGTAAAVEAVAESLPRERDVPLVLDPVLRSSSGGELLDEAGRRAMQERLFPMTTLLTPNIPEAARLCGGQPQAGSDTATRLAWAAQLLARGPRAVLIKGGHAAGTEAADLLARADGTREWLSSARLAGTLRGTGCALASAIAAGLARGQALGEACWNARRYVLDLLAGIT